MISIKNLSFQYQKQHKLFDNLNIELKTGNIYGLLGRNGAGKTTLLKIISGLLYPQLGECNLNGISTKDRIPDALQEVFFIPEEFELPQLTIESFKKIHAPFYPKFSHEEFESYLEQFGINSSLKIKNLSFGQVKMVIISFGLAANTKYLILDEPSNALDIPSKSLLRKFLAGAINENRSFIISTHQVRDLESLIDPIVILDNGKVIMHKTCEEIVEKFCFKTLREIAGAEVLFSEEKLGKFDAICLNTKKEDSRLNLELLFNGVTQNHGAFEKILIQ